MKDFIGWTLIASAVALALVILAVAYVAAFRGPGVHRRSDTATPRNVDRAPRRPDPYVIRWCPNPHDARWRRWSRRAMPRLYGGNPLPPLADESHVWGLSRGWRPPAPARRAVERAAYFEDTGALVRPYIARMVPQQRGGSHDA